MQAVILAGGRATRLGDIARDVPKTLVPVAGRPFLAHQLELLRDGGVDSVVLLTGHLGEQVEAFAGDGASFGLRITYSVDDPPRGTGAAVQNALHLLEPVFTVVNGDTYLPLDYARLGAALDDGVDALVAVAPPATQAPPNVRLEDDTVQAYRKGGVPGGQWVAAGATVLRRAAVEGAPIVGLEEDLYPRLARWGRLAALRVSGDFVDIGTPEGLELLRARLDQSSDGEAATSRDTGCGRQSTRGAGTGRPIDS